MQADTCTVAVARHILEAEAPFGKAQSASCMLLRASHDGDLEGIYKALDEGADIDTRLPMWMRLGPPALSNDADDSDEERSGAEPFNSKSSSLTPLMHAAHEGHAEAVKVLLRLGARVDLHEADGMQALHFAAMSASVDCFRMLLGAGANPVATDNFGRDALECVPLAQVANSPSKHEWVMLFKEAACWSVSVHDDAKKSDCDARLHEEAGEPSTTALTNIDEEGIMEKAFEKDVEEACLSGATAGTSIITTIH